MNFVACNCRNTEPENKDASFRRSFFYLARRVKIKKQALFFLYTCYKKNVTSAFIRLCCSRSVAEPGHSLGRASSLPRHTVHQRSHGYLPITPLVGGLVGYCTCGRSVCNPVRSEMNRGIGEKNHTAAGTARGLVSHSVGQAQLTA